MALQSRQPGSSFKPIFYTEALDRKLITPASLIKDQPTTYGGNYRPTNYDFKYRGNVTVRSALALSMNIPAVEIMQKLGPTEAAQAAQRMGLSTVTEPDKYGLSLGLGTAEVKPLELTNAYAAFANQGEQHNPIMFTRVVDKFGDSVYEEEASNKRRVVSPEAAYLVSSILSDNQARASTFGNSLTITGRQVAAKTGTTNDNRDAWTVGYSPSLAMGVWMGNNENQPMSGLAGASSAGTIWKQAMTQMVADTPNETFIMPEGVTKIRVCVQQANYEEVFIKGSEPKESCAKPAPVNNQQRKEEKNEVKEQQKKNEEEQKPAGGTGNGSNSGEGGRGGGTDTTSSPTGSEPTPAPTEPAPADPPPPTTQPTGTNTSAPTPAP
jgi:membrane peptidoglycan carboxypeptidase